MRSRGSTKSVIPAIFVVCLLAAQVIRVPAAPAQATFSSLSGSVSDEANAAIANVELLLMNIDNGYQRSATSDEHGFFTIPLLAPGRYVLSARMPGFATLTCRLLGL